MMDQLAGGHSADLVAVFFAAMVNIYGVLAAAFIIQAVLRLRSEETTGGAEAVLATAVGRFRWAASHLSCAVGGAAAILLLSGAAMGIADAAVGGSAGIGTLIGAGLAQLPAALVMAGFVVVVYGGLPSLVVALAWAGYVISLACGLFGDMLGLPQWARDISPFTHVPAIPAVDYTPGSTVALVAVAAVLGVVGLVGFRRRDVPTA
jgi:polyether ionophore transport system permease protein